jgi:CHAT domain-containing protein/tetratricopeptide (TPR) repeat protein
MNRFLKKVLLLAFFYAGAMFMAVNVHAQSGSLHDSLKHLLVYFQTNTKEEKIQNAVKDALAVYTSKTEDDSLSQKLLGIEDLVINASTYDKDSVVSYAGLILQLFQALPPQYEHPAYVKGLFTLAYLHEQIGEYETALKEYEQTANVREKLYGEESPDYAESMNSLGSLFERMGNYEKALTYAQRSLAIRKKILGEEHPDYAKSLTTIVGILYDDLGRNAEALPLAQQALSIRKKTLGEEDPYYAESLNNLAGIYASMGEYEKALPLYQQEVVIMKKVVGEEHPDFALTLNDLAILYVDLGRYDKARELFEKVLALRRKVLGPKHPYYALSLSNLSALYVMQGEYSGALPFAQEALEIRRKTLGEENGDYAISLHTLGNLYMHLGNVAKADSLLQKALAIRQRLGEDGYYYVNCLNSLARLNSQKGNIKLAQNYYQQAEAICKKNLGEEHPDYAASLVNLASITADEPATSSSLLIQASSIILQNIRRTYSTLSEQEKIILLSKEVTQLNHLPSLAFTQKASLPSLHSQLYTNELAIKGMALESQKEVLGSLRKANDSTAGQLFNQWRLNKGLLGRQLLLPLAEREYNADSLQETVDELEQQLSRSSEAFRHQQQSQSIRVKDISEKLSAGQAAIEFIRFPIYHKEWTDSVMYAALVLLPKDSVPRFVPLFEEKQLNHWLQHFAAIADDDVYTAVDHLYGSKGRGLGDSLYCIIWQPLEKYLNGINTIYYAPTGLLYRIAFQAIPAGNNQRLVDKYQLNQVLSTRLIAFPSTVAKPATANIWGNINYDGRTNAVATRGPKVSTKRMDAPVSSFVLYNEDTRGVRGTGWDPLPWTKLEVDSLRKMFTKARISVTTNSSALATEEAFKALDGRSPQVLHLATHGFFLPVKESSAKNSELSGGNSFTVQQNPLFRSGLVLAGGNPAWKGNAIITGMEDGILTAYEIAQMDLSNTELVVLSACETALGDLQGNEGVIGLQRAFKMAGVKQLIVSLWSIPDSRATVQLMTAFYRNWFSGQSTREAFRNAQLKIKKAYPSPFFWASFVLVE